MQEILSGQYSFQIKPFRNQIFQRPSPGLFHDSLVIDYKGGNSMLVCPLETVGLWIVRTHKDDPCIYSVRLGSIDDGLQIGSAS